MRNQRLQTKVRQLLLLLLGTLLLANPAMAVTLNLQADARTVSMPDGATIAMWGFFDNADATSDWAPIAIEVTDGSLTINLTNNLTEPVSLVITGQNMAYSNANADRDSRGRLLSLAPTVAPGATGSFSWSNMKPGSFLLQSGAHPALQVHMGLYGSVVVRDYADVGYDTEQLLLLSEIDPVLHAAAESAKALNYRPRYFLINGQPYVSGDTIAAGSAGRTLLLRMLNIGLKTHTLMLLNGPDLKIIAEDGNLYPYPRKEYAALLPPGKTKDALWTPVSEGTYALIDRSGYLSTDGQADGGQQARLVVSAGSGGVGSPVANDDSYALDEDTLLAVAAAGALGNDSPGTYTDTSLYSLQAELLSSTSYGTLVLNADGGFDYTPNANVNGSDSFSYVANIVEIASATVVASSAPATVALTINAVNDAPVAVADSASTDNATAISINVLANDSDIDSASLSVASVDLTGTSGSVVNNGTDISYTPAAGFVGSDSFSYIADDGGAANNLSNPATVTIEVTDSGATTPNQAPIASNGGETMKIADGSLIIDMTQYASDPDGTIVSVCVNLTDCANPTEATQKNGTVTVAGTSVTYTPPSAAFTGSDNFSYKVFDNNGAESNTARMRVNVKRK